MKLTAQQIRSLEELEKTAKLDLSDVDLSKPDLGFHAALALANAIAENEKVQLDMLMPKLMNANEAVARDLLMRLSGKTSFADPDDCDMGEMVEKGEVGLFSESDWGDCDPVHYAVFA